MVFLVPFLHRFAQSPVGFGHIAVLPFSFIPFLPDGVSISSTVTFPAFLSGPCYPAFRLPLFTDQDPFARGELPPFLTTMGPSDSLHGIAPDFPFLPVIPRLPCARMPALGRYIYSRSRTMQGLPRSHRRAFAPIPAIITIPLLFRPSFHLVLGCRLVARPPLVRFRSGLDTGTRELRTQPHDCALPVLFMFGRIKI